MITDDTYDPDSTGPHDPHDDWERGYAKGYERALQHVQMLWDHPDMADALRRIVTKLRKEVLNDTPDAQH